MGKKFNLRGKSDLEMGWRDEYYPVTVSDIVSTLEVITQFPKITGVSHSVEADSMGSVVASYMKIKKSEISIRAHFTSSFFRKTRSTAEEDQT